MVILIINIPDDGYFDNNHDGYFDNKPDDGYFDNKHTWWWLFW